MLHAHVASTEASLVARARAEAREALLRYRLTGEHTLAHTGNPTNECADVTALLGRKSVDLPDSQAAPTCGLATSFVQALQTAPVN